MLKLRLPEQFLTERLVLRRVQPQDAPEMFYSYASKPRATRFVSFRTHQRIEDTYAFIEYATHAWNAGRDYTYVIRLRENDVLIGSIGVVNNAGHIQFGYILSPTRWGKGYATEAVRVIVQALAEDERLISLSTFVAIDNQASAGVLRKCGLRPAGELPDGFVFPNCGNERLPCLRFTYPLETEKVEK